MRYTALFTRVQVDGELWRFRFDIPTLPLVYVAPSDRGRVLAFHSRIHRSCNNSAFVSGVNIVRNLAEVGTQYANFP